MSNELNILNEQKVIEYVPGNELETRLKKSAGKCAWILTSNADTQGPIRFGPSLSKAISWYMPARCELPAWVFLFISDTGKKRIPDSSPISTLSDPQDLLNQPPANGQILRPAPLTTDRTKSHLSYFPWIHYVDMLNWKLEQLTQSYDNSGSAVPFSPRYEV